MRLTELPAGLHEGEPGVVGEERDGLHEEVRRRLEVGVEHGDELAALHVAMPHPFLEVAGLVARPVLPSLVLDVDPVLGPLVALAFHQLLIEITANKIHINLVFYTC